jgi:hypothetical protein
MQHLKNLEVNLRLENILNELGLNYDVFSKILIKYNAIVSGSFLLQVIKNVFYPKTDIDIYVFGNVINEELQTEIKELFGNAIKKHNKKINIGENTVNFVNYLIDRTNRIFNTGYDAYASIVPLIYVNELSGLNTNVEKIQICYIDPTYCDDQNYDYLLLNHYDFDFCANYWNGTDIYVKDINSINSSSCIYTISKLCLRNRELVRICKYLDRGFDIKIKFNDEIYQTKFEPKYNEEQDVIPVDIPECNNLILIHRYQGNFDTRFFNYDNLPVQLKKLIIYSFPRESVLSENLPVGLEEIRFYSHSYEKKSNKKYKINKLPFGCSVYIDDVCTS